MSIKTSFHFVDKLLYSYQYGTTKNCFQDLEKNFQLGKDVTIDKTDLNVFLHRTFSLCKFSWNKFP